MTKLSFRAADKVREERCQLTWPGKEKSGLLANSPVVATLRPCREESVAFDETENLYIEGDNLDVLKLLRETYLNRVKMIYIDPPYNTGKNYIYKNKFVSQNTGTGGKFHTDWLNMMYPRLKLTKDFLTKDGVLVCAIDENEFPSLALLIREIFGEIRFEHSYVSVVHNPRGQQGLNFSYVNDYLIFVYPNDGRKYIADFPKEEVDSRNLRDSGSESDRADARSCFYPFVVKNGIIEKIGDVPEDGFHPKAANVPLAGGSVEVWPMTDGGDEKKWRFARQTVEGILSKLEVRMGKTSVQIIFNKEFGTMRSVWANARYDASEYGTKLLDKLFGGGASFTFPKSLWAVYDCVWAVTQSDKNAIVMDFFSGSATTAHAVMQLNAADNGKRKFIMVQLPENLEEAAEKASDSKTRKAVKSTIEFLDSIGKRHTICEIGKERIRRAGALIKQEKPMESQNLDMGFRVLKLDNVNTKDVQRAPED